MHMYCPSHAASRICPVPLRKIHVPRHLNISLRTRAQAPPLILISPLNFLFLQLCARVSFLLADDKPAYEERKIIDSVTMNNRRVIIAFLVLFIPIVYILWVSSSLVALIFEDGLKDSVDLAAIEKNANQSSARHPIPKILHQTWKNNNIPEQWQIAQFTWYILKPLLAWGLQLEAWTCTQTIIIW
jgi:hypothetical protein